MKIKSTTYLLCTLIALSACSDNKSESKENRVTKTPVTQVKSAQKAPTNKLYSLEQIYNAMCIQCHSSDGSGNTEKLTPSMKSFTQAEIQKALQDVEDEKGHVIMQHNREQILKKGMEYSAKDMAEYMYKRFK